MKKTTHPPDDSASGAPSRRPASVCAQAAPVLLFEDAPPARPTLRTRYRLRLEVEATVDLGDAAPLRHAEDALRFLWRNAFVTEPREVVAVVFADGANRPTGHQIAYSGGLSGCLAEPRHILASALLANASAVLVAHNHPSGDVAPSAEDIAATSRLYQAAEAVGIRVIDSLILARDGDGFRCCSITSRRTARISTQPLTPGAHPARPISTKGKAS